MCPDEVSSYLLCFGTPAPTIPSPGRLLCSHCCQQDCFPFGFPLNISIQNIFCIFIGRPQTCGLSSLGIESICGSQRGVQAAAASHATPSSHHCPRSRSHPIPIPTGSQLQHPLQALSCTPCSCPRPSLPHSCCHSPAMSLSVFSFQKIPFIYLVTTPAQ